MCIVESKYDLQKWRWRACAFCLMELVSGSGILLSSGWRWSEGRGSDDDSFAMDKSYLLKWRVTRIQRPAAYQNYLPPRARWIQIAFWGLIGVFLLIRMVLLFMPCLTSGMGDLGSRHFITLRHSLSSVSSKVALWFAEELWRDEKTSTQ